MVMAGTAPGPTTDVSLSARLQWLQQRREQLQEKLALKNGELKNLCLDEAELTGILPPEIPLEPGESPPAFRKRVGTCFSYPQNLINRLKTNEAEESSLELERQVQVGIAETSLGKLNDPTESKTVRRKHRSIYQQSQRRLRELDARLSFIRQSYGRIQRQSSQTPNEATSHSGPDVAQTSSKHRTKKPRPPLDSPGYETCANTLSPRSILQETGVSLSPLGIETHLQNSTYRQNAWSPGRGYRSAIVDDDTSAHNITSDMRNYNNPNVTANYDPTIDRNRRRNVKYMENDQNDNNDVYILPDRYRQRTYSQGNNTNVNTVVPKYCQDTERTYRTIPNTYTEEERQMRYRQMQQKRNPETQNLRQNIIIDQQHALTHQKPPLHLSSNYHHHHHHHHHHQQQYHDGHTSQPSYYQSDEFVNRSQNRYVTVPDETRLSQRKNSSYLQQRPIDRRDNVSTPLSRLSRTNLQESTRSDGQLAAGCWIRENDEIVWCPDDALSASNERFGSLDRRKYSSQCNPAYSTILQTKERANHEDRERYGNQQNHNIPGTRDYALGLPGTSKFSSSSAVTSHQQNYNSQVHQHIVSTTTAGTTTTTTTMTTTTTTAETTTAGTTTAMNTTMSYERISPSPPAPRTLLRTQSLGSVETWQQQQQQNIVMTPDVLRGREISQTASREDTIGRSRAKEKEWYETSMDSSYSTNVTTIPTTYEYTSEPLNREIVQSRKIPQPSSSSPHHGRHIVISCAQPPAPPPLPSPPLPSLSFRENVASPVETRNIQQRRYPHQQNVIQQQQQQQRHPASSPKSLEIPAESKKSTERRRNCHVVVDEQKIMNTANNDRSPDICTIVQAGKYQPYREVTKPFEMSDFYKYSTKYRKRNEAAAAVVAVTTNTTNHQQQVLNVEIDEEDAVTRRRNETILTRDEETTSIIVNPVQRRIYEPVQRMTCQPYGINITRRQQATESSEDDEWRGTTNNRASSEDSTVV